MKFTDEQVDIYMKMEDSILYFIDVVWKLTPQPIRGEYEARWKLGLLLSGEAWKSFCKQVRPEWFGEFEQGKHITWQQTLVLIGIEKAVMGAAPSRISIVSGHGCHSKGTKILMYDGSLKNVEDIKEGDKLMGDDSMPRTVLSLARGKEQMYRIKYFDGSYYDVNESHKLSLVASQSHGLQRKGDITDIIVRDYLKWSARKKRTNIGYKRAVNFNKNNILKIDPYLLGLWLGDGTSDCANITNEDLEVIDYLERNYKTKIKTKKRNTVTILIKELYLKLKEYNLLKNKHIPHDYLTSSMENRLQLLAGIIDTDGYKDKSGYEIVQKNKLLAEQIQFLARSVGCNATFKKVHKTCTNSSNGRVTGVYYMVYISRNIWKIPCKILRKQSIKPPKAQRENLHFGFEIEKLEVDHYYGFEVDGNHKFLLGDFTVTNNTGKSTMASWIVLWFLYVHPSSQVACTSPGSAQLYDVLWKELKKWIDKMPLGIAQSYIWESTHIRMKENSNVWFARAKTSSKENTEALAGVHADHVLLIADEACFDDQTEILTEDGWKFFKDLNRKERVYTKNQQTGKVILELPINYHEYDHNGMMISHQKRGTDFMVTPNHDLWVKTRNSGFKKKKAENFTKNSDYFYSKTIDWDGNNHISEDMVRFYAWFISEGNYIFDKKGIPVSLVISQSLSKNFSNYKEIEKICDNLKFNTTKTKKSIVIYGTEFAKKIYGEVGKGFDKKRIPNHIKQLNKDLLKAFIDSYVKGDGYRHGNQRIIYCSNKLLSDDLQEIVLKTGVNCTLGIRKITGQKKWILNHWATSTCDNYIIRISDREYFGKINGKDLKHVYYQGKVYCVTVPNGLIITRRNGYVMWSGNSGVEEPIYETMEGALTSGNTIVFLISNGTRNTGYFYDTHHKDSARWQNYSFSSLDSPKVDQKYVDNIVEKYGADSVQYAIRVEGKFPDEGVMDDKGYVQLFNEKDLHFVPFDSNWKPIGKAIGALDASGEGQDISAWAVRDRQRAGIIGEEEVSTAASMGNKSVTICDKFMIDPIDFVIDSFGKGSDVSMEIALITSNAKNPWRTFPVNVGEPCDDDYDKLLYVNKRAEMYYKFMKWCQAGGELMESRRLKDELLSVRFKRTLNGRIQIMDKVTMKKMGFPSPNKADAIALTFLRPDGIRRVAADGSTNRSTFNPYTTCD